jgi:ribonuclease D
MTLQPILVTKSRTLRRTVEELSKATIIAVDTESNSLYAYQERVCLIQFSTKKEDYLVDPLAIDDLTPLAPLFSNPSIEKVFHAAEYDLTCMLRDFGFRCNHIFDTMVAARILGRDAVGLGSMLETEFGVRLNKRYQRANWGQRPLPPDLLDYARLDTRYLIPLRDRLKLALIEDKRWDLAQEDFKRLCSMQPNRDQDNHSPSNEVNPWRISGSYDLAPQQAAVLLELCRYRDRKARSMDRPLFKVIGDQTLLAIAAGTPTSLKELKSIQGMSAKQVKRHGAQLLKSVQEGLISQPIYPPRTPRPSSGYLARMEALRKWRKNTAQKMGVMSDVVLPRDLLYRLVSENPHNTDELTDTLHEVPWRLEHFSEQILTTLQEAGT